MTERHAKASNPDIDPVKKRGRPRSSAQIVKSPNSEPVEPVHYEINWRDKNDLLDIVIDNDLLEKAKKFVKAEFFSIKQAYEKDELKKAREKFHESLRGRGPRPVAPRTYKVFQGAKPVRMPPFQILPNEDKMKVAKGRVTETAGVRYVPALPMKPRMKYWVHTERNVAAPDCLRLSHIPYIDDDDGSEDKSKFVEDLRLLYTEGIHGADPSFDYINDYMMFKLYKAVEQKWTHDPRYIHYVTFKYFPNKYSYKQLVQGEVLVSLKERFEPTRPDALPADAKAQPIAQVRGTAVNDENDVMAVDEKHHSIVAMSCPQCTDYDCPRHGLAPDVHEKGVDLLPTTAVGTIVTAEGQTACGEDCYLRHHQLDDETPSSSSPSVPALSSSLILSTFHTRIAASSFEMCRVARQMNAVCRASGLPETSCHMWHQMTEARRAETAPNLPPREKKINSRDRYNVFRVLRSDIDNSAQMIPCDHDGPCAANIGCPCFDNNSVCTKKCRCSLNCRIKFPGCSCSPGYCRSNSCACFIARWECDPDTCKSCNCDPLNVMTKQDGAAQSMCCNVMLQNRMIKQLKLGTSKVAGFGCFIAVDAERGDLISEYTGEIISDTEAERRGWICDKAQSSYVFRLNNNQSIDAGRMGNLIRFANHSEDDPNCEAKTMIVGGEQRIGVYARRHIPAGEELFFDYAYSKDAKKYVDIKINKEKTKTKASSKK